MAKLINGGVTRWILLKNSSALIGTGLAHGILSGTRRDHYHARKKVTDKKVFEVKDFILNKLGLAMLKLTLHAEYSTAGEIGGGAGQYVVDVKLFVSGVDVFIGNEVEGNGMVTYVRNKGPASRPIAAMQILCVFNRTDIRSKPVLGKAIIDLDGSRSISIRSI